ncbi:nucleoside triphosphate pyrophosphohydrolase [Micromonospora sp. NPDC049645]|uniref:nucleoside triphosphate pyrophosphohydrolase n=1 Tax=Micromonospora sp. NPDC049645 TaxID=3155508 RepID=UPI00342C67F4
MPAKLVRDRIPAIIEAAGRSPVIRRAEPREMLPLLRAKLVEEVDEFLASDDPMELADVLEVVFALASRLNLSQTELEQARARKAADNGAFNDGVILLGR